MNEKQGQAEMFVLVFFKGVAKNDTAYIQKTNYIV